MNRGFTFMVTKPRINRRSGSMNPHHNQKKQDKVRAIRSQCSLFFSDYKSLVYHEYENMA